MAVAGLRGTGDWGPDERPKNFRESILWMKPNGNAPLFALTAKAGKKTVRDPEYYWWAEPQNLVRLQVSGALGLGDTLVTIDSADPTASTLGAHWGKATHLKPGDHLLVEPSADNATFDHEVVEVTQVISETQFMVSRGAQGTAAAAIDNDAYLLLIGSAYGEGTSAPQARSRNPLKYYNLIQIFKDAYEITGTADVTETRTGNAMSNDKKRKMFDHARAIEFSMLFGRRSETVDPINGKPKRTMNGLRTQVGHTTVFGSAVTIPTFLDAIAPMFNFDAGDTDNTRICFAGNDARLELAKMMLLDTSARFTLTATTKMWGMDFEEFTTPLGKVLLRTHPLMSQHPLYKKSAFCLDFAAIKYVTMPGRDTKPHDDVQAKDEDVRRGYVQTDCSIMLDGGGLTCTYLGNISAT